MPPFPDDPFECHPARRRPASCATLLAVLLVLGNRLAAQQHPPAPVAVETVDIADIRPVTSILGSAEPRRRSTVAATVEGDVVEYLAREGIRVEKGQVLARLRDSTLRLQVKEAEAALAEARERHRKAVLDRERAEKLLEEDAVAQKSYDAAVTEERALWLQISQREARLEILRDELDRKVVRAPFDGEVIREGAELGEWLARGGEVAEIVDLESVYIRVHVPERLVRFLRAGQSLQAVLPATEHGEYRGTVVSIAGAGDPSARTFAVRVEIENDGELRAGMSARVALPAAAARRGLVVPKDALLLDGQQDFVYVVRDGAAERRNLRLGVAVGGDVEVLEGLTRGERVVVKGNERIQPGMPVRIVGDGEKVGDNRR